MPRFLIISLIVTCLTISSCGKATGYLLGAAAGVAVVSAIQDDDDDEKVIFLPPPTGTGTGTIDIDAYEQGVFSIVNTERALQGAAPLEWDNAVAAVARAHSECQRDHDGFYHVCPYGHGVNPGDRLTAAGIAYLSLGENIARGQDLPAAVMNAWMDSAGHRANILNPEFTHIGVGLAVPGYHWTQVFIWKP